MNNNSYNPFAGLVPFGTPQEREAKRNAAAAEHSQKRHAAAARVTGFVNRKIDGAVVGAIAKSAQKKRDKKEVEWEMRGVALVPSKACAQEIERAHNKTLYRLTLMNKERGTSRSEAGRAANEYLGKKPPFERDGRLILIRVEYLEAMEISPSELY